MVEFDEALSHVSRSLAVREASNPTEAWARRRLADEYRLRAELLRRKRSFAASRDDLLRCHDVRRTLVESHPERLTYRVEEGQTLIALGLIHMALREPKLAQTWYERAHKVLEAQHAEAPGHLVVSMAFARSLQGLGQIELSNAISRHAKGSEGRTSGLEGALARFERAHGLVEGVATARPDSADATALLDQLTRQVQITKGALQR